MLTANTITSLQQAMNSLWNEYKTVREDRDNFGITDQEAIDLFEGIREITLRLRKLKERKTTEGIVI